MAARRALTLLLYVLLPPVIFFNLAAADIDLEPRRRPGPRHRSPSSLGLAARLVGREPGACSCRGLQTGAVVCAVLSVNTGYLGYPLTVALLGRDQLSTAVLYDVLVTGPCLLLGAFAVGAAFGTKAGETPRQRVRAFFTRNPPLYAAIAGLLAPQALAPHVAGRHLAGADRRDPADRLLRRRRHPGRERRARRAADAAAADPPGGARARSPASPSCRPC